MTTTTKRRRSKEQGLGVYSTWSSVWFSPDSAAIVMELDLELDQKLRLDHRRFEDDTAQTRAGNRLQARSRGVVSDARDASIVHESYLFWG